MVRVLSQVYFDITRTWFVKKLISPLRDEIMVEKKTNTVIKPRKGGITIINTNRQIYTQLLKPDICNFII